MIGANNQILTANGYKKVSMCNEINNFFIYDSSGKIVKAKVTQSGFSNLVKIITDHGDIICEENQIFRTIDDLNIAAKDLKGEEIFQFYFPKVGIIVKDVIPYESNKKVYEVYLKKENPDKEEYFVVNGFCLKGKEL